MINYYLQCCELCDEFIAILPENELIGTIQDGKTISYGWQVCTECNNLFQIGIDPRNGDLIEE